MIRFVVTCMAAMALSVGAWADCPNNCNQGRCPRGGEGKCKGGECQNPKCPRTNGGGGTANSGQPGPVK